VQFEHTILQFEHTIVQFEHTIVQLKKGVFIQCADRTHDSAVRDLLKNLWLQDQSARNPFTPQMLMLAKGNY
jgi:hypothetical protein